MPKVGLMKAKPRFSSRARIAFKSPLSRLKVTLHQNTLIMAHTLWLFLPSNMIKSDRFYGSFRVLKR